MANIFLKDIVREVAYSARVEKETVERVLRESHRLIGEHLANMDKVYLIDFVNLEPKKVKGKSTVNPRTLEPMYIDSYVGLNCKPTSYLKNLLNKQ
jgi:nucleoid DNA-binding protein